MTKSVDLTGQKFNRLTVVERLESDKWRKVRWRCSCECGNETTVTTDRLRAGTTKSCGCLSSEVSKVANLTHGETVGGKFSKEYITWVNMRLRCNNPRHTHYQYYGGRGITVCDLWASSFENFLADMGRAPSPRHSIDRENNDGNYEPGNCRWATPEEQAKNKRHNRETLLTLNGVTKNISDWAREAGVSHRLLLDRLGRQGMSLSEAMTAPVRCNSKLITYGGETLLAKEWAARLGVAPSTLCTQMKRMGVIEAISFYHQNPVKTPKRRVLTFNGKTGNLPYWSQETGIDYQTLYWRVKLGWPAEKVLTTPIA